MSEKTKKYFEKNAFKNRDRLTDRDLKKVSELTQRLKEPASGALAGSAAGAVAADVAGSIDPYLSRNEFKEGFYDQISKRPVDAETMFGKGTKRGFEYPTVDPDTKMMQDAQGMAEGGSVRGQKNIQVKKKPFRGIF
jgi:hypothetical protein